MSERKPRSVIDFFAERAWRRRYRDPDEVRRRFQGDGLSEEVIARASTFEAVVEQHYLTAISRLLERIAARRTGSKGTHVLTLALVNTQNCYLAWRNAIGGPGKVKGGE